jgi:hypothetical protein
VAVQARTLLAESAEMQVRTAGDDAMRFLGLMIASAFALLSAPIQAAGLLDRSANRLPDIVDQDNGGNLLKRIEFVEHHRNDDVYRLPVECFSSCTLLLGISGACVPQGSVLYFHGATIDGKLAPAYLNDYAASYYPANVKRWVAVHHALQKVSFTRMTLQQAAAIGVKVCP